MLVDLAQSAGVMPLEVGQMGIDMLAFPGHKGLLGPQGTGGLYIAPNLDVQPASMEEQEANRKLWNSRKCVLIAMKQEPRIQ